MLTINLEESDCFAAWISVTDVAGLEPKVVDGKGVFWRSMTEFDNCFQYINTSVFVFELFKIWLRRFRYLYLFSVPCVVVYATDVKHGELSYYRASAGPCCAGEIWKRSYVYRSR